MKADVNFCRAILHNFYQTLLQPHISTHYARSACSIRLKLGVLRSIEAYAADSVNQQAYSTADGLQKAKTARCKACLTLRSIDVSGDEYSSTKRLCFDCFFNALSAHYHCYTPKKLHWLSGCRCTPLSATCRTSRTG